jgi:hypothetical protein
MQLVHTLQSTNDANDRLLEVERELVEAQDVVNVLKALKFLGKYADYIGKVVIDIHYLDPSWPRTAMSNIPTTVML